MLEVAAHFVRIKLWRLQEVKLRVRWERTLTSVVVEGFLFHRGINWL